MTNLEEHCEIDFGEPNPFVVPQGWIEQFSDIDPNQGLRGTL